ncbi:glycosyltransferase [Amnibacterium setariae]|nr:glycosyltransferase [Amnibacterium setariae]
MPAVALVSFTIHPTAGSEAGVGWAFLSAALALRPAVTVHLVLDARDEDAVRLGLQRLAGAERVVLHAVAVPGPILQRYGDRRTRESYLAWLPAARRRLRAIGKAEPLTVAHQVTFASAVLPSVLTAGVADRLVWGPLSVPASASGGAGRIAVLGRAAVRIAGGVAARNLRVADLVVVNNDHTRAFAEGLGHAVAVEPNIVVERQPGAFERDERSLVIAGHLVERKRPWLAISALRDPRLSGVRLDVLGDGPLRPMLERLAQTEGVADRVRFHGAVERSTALEVMSRARLLVHPSSREGSPWVVGEAAACGLASVVMPGSGAEATVRLCDNGGVVAPPGEDLVGALADGVVEALRHPVPGPSDRWSAGRMPGLLRRWYGLGD